MFHGQLHPLIGFDEIHEPLKSKLEARGAVDVVDFLADGFQVFGIWQEVRRWWLVWQNRADGFWVTSEEFERHDCAGTVACDCGGCVGGDVFDQMGGVVGVCFETVSVVLCAYQVALREASSFVNEERC